MLRSEPLCGGLVWLVLTVNMMPQKVRRVLVCSHPFTKEIWPCCSRFFVRSDSCCTCFYVRLHALLPFSAFSQACAILVIRRRRKKEKAAIFLARDGTHSTRPSIANRLQHACYFLRFGVVSGVSSRRKRRGRGACGTVIETQWEHPFSRLWVAFLFVFV